MRGLPPEIEIGPVHLTVADLERSLAFYAGVLGMRPIEKGAAHASLGTAGRTLLHLTEVPGARHVTGRTGLYHFALLYPSREELGNVLQNLVDNHIPLSGGADHLVSEAIYLNDPDGSGIELYRDRPRHEWLMENGRPKMDTLPLHFEGILAGASQNAAAGYEMPQDTLMGHLHLHVADLAAALAFYEEIVGFDLMGRYGGVAAFLSAGGYHHHLGLNTWAGVGAPPPPPRATGLRAYEILLPDNDSLAALTGRLRSSETPHEIVEQALIAADPSANQVRFSLGA